MGRPLRVWNGTDWEPIAAGGGGGGAVGPPGPEGPQGPAGPPGADAQSAISYGDTPPADPSPGDLWIKPALTVSNPDYFGFTGRCRITMTGVTGGQGVSYVLQVQQESDPGTTVQAEAGYGLNGSPSGMPPEVLTMVGGLAPDENGISGTVTPPGGMNELYIDLTANPGRAVVYLALGGHVQHPVDGEPGFAAVHVWDGSGWASAVGVEGPAGSGLDEAAADARYVNAAGDTMTGPLSFGAGRTIPSPSGGMALQPNGLNNDIIMEGRQAGVSGNWAALRVHPGSGVRGLLVKGDTNQGGLLIDCENAAGESVHSVSPAGQGFFKTGLNIPGGERIHWDGDQNISIAREPGQAWLAIHSFGGTLFRNRATGAESVMYGRSIELRFNGQAWTMDCPGDGALNFGKANGGADGNVNFSTGTGSLHVNGAVVAPSSDERLKQDIQPLPPMLDRIRQVRPVSFKWKPEYDNPYYPDRVNLGVVAQEINEVFPEVVTVPDELTRDDGDINPMSVAYSSLVPALIKAMQELSEQVDALRARVAELEGNV